MVSLHARSWVAALAAGPLALTLQAFAPLPSGAQRHIPGASTPQRASRSAVSDGPRASAGPGTVAFDPSRVVAIEIELGGSGAVDTLRWDPHPDE